MYSVSTRVAAGVTLRGKDTRKRKEQNITNKPTPPLYMYVVFE